ncbi:MAG: response regulator transcription factor [Elusimicrobiales bacterium]
MPAKILVVEDEKNIAAALRYNLEKAGYIVAAAADGETALKLHEAGPPDLVLLDVMLPKVDGLEVCRRIRQKHSTPVIMLTAKKEELDRVLGLELGADDYVSKPFSMRELLARVKAVLRRRAPEESPVFRAGDIEIDFDKYEVRVAGGTAALSTKEFELLRCLARAGGKALTRDQIMEQVWGYERSMELDTNTVDQHIARLRAKLGREAARIVTVKNVGYRVKTD